MTLYPIKLSLVIPTFNRADLIDQTLQSISYQTVRPFEVIVVDNASTDDTSSIVERYRKFGIKYYQNSRNLGMVGNYNKCLELASGDYISFLHSDDLISPNWCETWLKTIKNHPADLYNCSSCVIDEKNHVSYIFHTFPKNTFLKKSSALYELLTHDCPLVAPLGATVFSRLTLIASTPFIEELGTEADALVSLRAISKSSVYYVHQILFAHRFHTLQTFDLSKHQKTDAGKLSRLNSYLILVRDFASNNLPDERLRRLFITTHVFMSLCAVNLYLVKLQFSRVFKSNRIVGTIFPDLYTQAYDIKQFVRIQAKLFVRALFGNFFYQSSRKNLNWLKQINLSSPI